MERYSPDQMELDARDVVARAIGEEIAEGRGTENGGVFLDISHRDRSFIDERLPRMAERFRDLGVELSEEPVEVAPTAHYGMGGVRVDDTGETSVDGLYAIGETMAGVHGANRLGGNSLAETIAFGVVAGESIAESLSKGKKAATSGSLIDRARLHIADLRELKESDGTHDPRSLLDELRTVLWERTGILRAGRGIENGLDELADLRTKATDLAVTDSHSYEFALNLGFGLVVAETILRSAKQRTESRGAHYRTDYPDTRVDWRKNIVARRGNLGGMELSTEPVGVPSEVVQAALDAEYELDYHQLE
jgi:succinate dehydrogenase / fumarate reductase flavoprotein subunit